MLRTLSLDFIRQGNAVFPKDPALHKLAVLYAEQNLADKVNFADFPKVFVACECDETGTPIAIHGLACGMNVVDFPVIRFTDFEAGDSLTERMRAYLEDLGLRGGHIFIHVADHEQRESRCPKWRKMLRKWRASKASRWAIPV